MVDTDLETVFHQLQLAKEDYFHPREGYGRATRVIGNVPQSFTLKCPAENTSVSQHGAEDHWFYVINVSRVPGIYTAHWEETSQRVTAFPSAVHKKYFGWSTARSAYKTLQLLKAMSPARPTHRSKISADICPPSNPPPAPHPQPKVETRTSTLATARIGAQTDPSTLTGSPKKSMYVYSRGNGSTIYADPLEASAAAPRGLADGSFHLILGHEATEEALKNNVLLTVFGHSLSNSLPARTGRLTADGRRAAVQSVPVSYELPDPTPSTLFGASTDDDNWLDVLDTRLAEPEATTMRSKRKRKWYATTDANLRHWVANFCGDYLRVLVTREGLMGQDPVCSCGQPAKYRCRCIVNRHITRPLCRIECWNGTFFDKRELRHLGLRVQLCHSDNQPCPRARPGRSKFVVVAPNGFHHVAIDFCKCRLGGSKHKWEQLLSYGWYPATPDDPQSTITISALKLFHAVSLQGKTTAYHFFNALAKITDNTGSSTFKRRYQLALRVVQQWRNLRALKCGGMGNDPDRRTSETREGELAVDCLACPRAGVNLPEGWEKASVEMRFLFTIFLAIDACFRLKRKNISSRLVDPSLQDSWAYFVWSFTYEDFVKTLGDQEKEAGLGCPAGLGARYPRDQEIIPSSNTEAGWASQKLRPTYGNMDYAVASAWKHFASLIFAKTFSCYSSSLVPCKLTWSSSGLMGASTREMEPGSRQDTLDDFWHYWNWNKVAGMGSTLCTRLLKARKELAWQTEALQDFTQAQQDNEPAWKQAVDDFETGSTLRDIELELAWEEKERERVSAIVRDAAENTMTEYLILGLEIEGQQSIRQLAADLAANKLPTSKELTDFVTRRMRISRQVKKLRVLQRKFSPRALQRLAASSEPIDPAEADTGDNVQYNWPGYCPDIARILPGYY
ncbi:hypothetical protein DFH08DRAFT_818177 [Mycena albidolilacea]|uniref:CxC2-like cysteine cluster KDZ transposase-associated domain-containing protein n=1 Tax=Mycena albidolilacea TaxID=1033008 RepID=A0AAD6ZGI6_9AGAR|nr:hypothetical protein DFH08DRAFT_818177 [Mycena albidolilacea]